MSRTCVVGVIACLIINSWLSCAHLRCAVLLLLRCVQLCGVPRLAFANVLLCFPGCVDVVSLFLMLLVIRLLVMRVVLLALLVLVSCVALV